MISKSLLFSAGCFAVSFFPVLPSPGMAAAFISFCLLLFYLSRQYRLLFLLSGLIWGYGWGIYLLQAQLPEDLEGQQFWVVGEIVGLPKQEQDKARIRLRVESIQAVSHQSIGHQSTVQESIASPSNAHLNLTLLQLSCFNQCPEFLPGQWWRMTVKLKRPRGFVNQGGFDYRLWLLQQGVSATGYIRGDVEAITAVNGDGFFNHFRFDRWRFALKTAIVNLPLSPRSQALLLALCIGDGSQLLADDWQILRWTGTVHLLVISGLHVGLVALLFYGTGSLLGRLVNLFLPRLPAPTCAVLLSIVGAFLFAGLSGFGLPSVRALVMICVVCGFKLLRKSIHHFTALALSLGVVSALQPLALHSPGFWLSFGAVLVLIFVFGSLVGTVQWWQKWLLPQWVVFVGLSLSLLLFFGQLSLLSPLVNIVAVPVVSLIIVPLALLTVVVLLLEVDWLLLWQLLDWLLQSLWGFLTWCAFYGERALLVLPVSITLVSGLLLFFSLWLLLLPKGTPVRYMSLLAILLVVANKSPKPMLTMTVLDVGQGLSVVIETTAHTLVYDSGAKFSERFNVGSGIVVPYLRSQGVESVDRLIVSHGDGDHAGGVDGLLAELTVTEIFSGEADAVMASLDGVDQTVTVSPCVSGQKWIWDDVSFEILSPGPNFTAYKPNNRSCVLLVNINGSKLLLPGDSEQEVEYRLQNRLQQEEGVDILVAPHHGSKTSSTETLVNSLKPDHVIYSAGFNHHFGHPHQKVVARYDKVGARQWNTAVDGAVTFIFHEGAWLVESRRHKDLKYWQN